MAPSPPPAVAGAPPPLLGGVRRTRLIAADRATVTVEGWDTWNGARVLLRAARAGHRGDPEVRRRLAAAARPDAVVPVAWTDDDWPRVVSGPYATCLADLLPLEAPADPVWAARVLGAALAAVLAAHRQGRAHGLVRPEAMLFVDGRWALADLGGPIDGADDLRDLGHLAAALIHPQGSPPLVERVADFAVHPPPSPGDAVTLVVHELAAGLAAARRELLLRQRRQGEHDRVGRLLGLARRLARAAAPPPGRGCLRAGHDGVLVLVETDGDRLRGGPSAQASTRWLPVVWSPERVDVPQLRALLRAWNTRGGGDARRREAANAELGGDDRTLDRLVRWIAATGRLRADRLLLEARERGA